MNNQFFEIAADCLSNRDSMVYYDAYDAENDICFSIERNHNGGCNIHAYNDEFNRREKCFMFLCETEDETISYAADIIAELYEMVA